MNFEEAQQLQISGKYSELLRGAVAEQARAAQAGDAEAEARWTGWIVKACRYVGRAVEGLAHAEYAVKKAEELGRPALLAEAVYAHALMLKVARRGDEGLAALDRAISLLPGDAPEIDRAVFELERAELALESGRPETALAALARGGAQVQWLENTRLLMWMLYLRALAEDDWTGEMQLSASLAIARTIRCPEFEWKILWRLSERAGRTARHGAEKDLSSRALGILKGLAADLHADDAPYFWREPVRAAFLDSGRKRFGDAFQEDPRFKSTGIWAGEDHLSWDPALLPEFVRASLRRSWSR